MATDTQTGTTDTQNDTMATDTQTETTDTQNDTMARGSQMAGGSDDEVEVIVLHSAPLQTISSDDEELPVYV